MKDLIAEFEANQVKKRVSLSFFLKFQMNLLNSNSNLQYFFLLQFAIVWSQSKPAVKRSMYSDDYNGNEPVRKMSKEQFSDYLRSFVQIERILDMRREKKNNSYQVIFLVEFKDSYEFEWIDATTVKRDYPRALCEFYEQCITWE